LNERLGRVAEHASGTLQMANPGSTVVSRQGLVIEAQHIMHKRSYSLLITVVCIHATAIAAAGAEPALAQFQFVKWPSGLPVYDHVVIVVEENKDYDQIIASSLAPYINVVLKAEGASFTQMYGEEHNSEGNYFWLFCGSNLDIGFDDVVPSASNHAGYPFTTSNLAEHLLKKGLSFKGFSESLPAIGSQVVYVNEGREHIYGRKHVPWISFGNVPNGTTEATSCNLRWKDFPAHVVDYSHLPTVSIVVPNLQNDMHNGKIEKSIPLGDAWLKSNLDPYYQWAKTHNSLLIVTFDESDEKTDYVGLTNPSVKPTDPFRKDLQNRIPTIFAGARIKCGQYAEGRGITHVNILRTLEMMYGLPKSGAQQGNAAGLGIGDDAVITDVFSLGP
jgi:acid phosphatase